ncbi:MAG: hypothetical protein KC516_03790 [Nanoarchaeota archaeon]|nr:hypothetical protein [Nanoarchaeota archaeon]
MKSITDQLKEKGIITIVGEIKVYGGGIIIVPNTSGGNERAEYKNEILSNFFSENSFFESKDLLVDLREKGLSDYSGVIVYIDASSGKPLEMIDPNYQEVIWKSK